MRTIVFFDLPTEKASQRKEYTKFVKAMKKGGFVMMQESVYVKFDLDQRAAESSVNYIKKIAPNEGSIALLFITEKQFSSILFVVGESKGNEIINNTDRTIEL